MFGLDSALMLLRKHITLESVFKTLLKANENKHQEKKKEWQTWGMADLCFFGNQDVKSNQRVHISFLLLACKKGQPGCVCM